MGIKRFSKKEAISHGFKMTKKYFGIAFTVCLIYVAFQVISWLLHTGAGSPIPKDSVRELYSDPASADNFYLYLGEAGYIDTYGAVQAKLQNITSASQLTLPAELEADRGKIFQFLNGHRYRLPFPKVIFYLLAIPLWAVGVFISIGWLKMGLALSRDQKPAVVELFSNVRLFVPFILGSFCYGLAVMGGLILLVVPGIIVCLMLSMFAYCIVDKGMGPIASLKASRTLTKGARWQLFCFGVLITLINIGGILCFVVGLLFTIPAGYIATAFVYDQLHKKDEIAV